jgi:hypothetical protein
VKLAGAPVMQLEGRNSVERDQIVSNRLGLLSVRSSQLSSRSASLMLVAALPPVIAVAWSLGLLGCRFPAQSVSKRHDPLIMVMGSRTICRWFPAIRIRLREGDN